jgi:hypothetical protein
MWTTDREDITGRAAAGRAGSLNPKKQRSSRFRSYGPPLREERLRSKQSGWLIINPLGDPSLGDRGDRADSESDKWADMQSAARNCWSGCISARITSVGAECLG